MYQLKITKKTDSLALQHFNDVKERLLADIHHFLSGKHRIMRKVKIAIHGDKPSEDLLRHLSNEENLKEFIVSHPDKLRDIISQLHPDAFDPEKKLNRILYHIFIIFGYEDDIFNKDGFYRQSQVGTCPYCNMADIHYTPATALSQTEKGVFGRGNRFPVGRMPPENTVSGWYRPLPLPPGKTPRTSPWS